jgi:hypothetical protein
MSDNEDLTLSSPTQSSTRLMNQGHANSNDKPLVFSIKPQIPSVKNFLLDLNNFFTAQYLQNNEIFNFFSSKDAQIAHPVALRYSSNNNPSNQHYQQQMIASTSFQVPQNEMHSNSK